MVVDDGSVDTSVESWNRDFLEPQFPSMVVIKDFSRPNQTNEFTIFPPINHENLQRSSSSSAASSSSDSDHSDSEYPSNSPSKSPEKRGELSVFPPTNHENLRSFSSPLSLSTTTSEACSSCLFSPSDSDQSDSDCRAGSPQKKRPSFRGSNWWLEIGMEALRMKALRLAASFGVSGSWGYGGVLAVMVVTVCTLWVGARQQRRIQGLLSALNERDEKNNKLLLQIAQLNEVLMARHRTLVSKIPN